MNGEDCLYLDIETTGLSPASSHLTVIGTAFLADGKPSVRQFVCEKPTDERKILREFASFAQGFSRLVHFNGRSFDLPYLRKKCVFYQIGDPLADLSETDLYRLSRRYRALLGADGQKQKDLEALLGFARTDRLSGADCVNAYRNYLLCGERSSLEKVLDHNREDLLGMLHIQKHFAAFHGLENGAFAVTDVTEAENALEIRFYMQEPFPAPAVLSFPCVVGDGTAAACFQIEGPRGLLALPVYEGELRYFFEDYRDYFYLPVEGRAVHRSVGQYVDSAFREKATAETAYEPVTGRFYPQSAAVIHPVFRAHAKDVSGFFRPQDANSADDYHQLVIDAFHTAL